MSYDGASFNEEVLKQMNRQDFNKELSPIWVGLPYREEKLNEVWKRIGGKDAEKEKPQKV